MVTLLLVIPMWYDLYSCSHSPMATTDMLWVVEEGGRDEEGGGVKGAS